MYANVWESLLSSVEKRINYQSFSTWFKPISYSHSSESSIFVRLPNPFFVEWICKNYNDILEESLKEQGLLDQKLQFLVEENSQGSAMSKETNRSANKIDEDPAENENVSAAK